MERHNVWSTIRHHTSSWTLLWRLLVLALGVAAVGGAVMVLMWLLDLRVGLGSIEVGPASN